MDGVNSLNLYRVQTKKWCLRLVLNKKLHYVQLIKYFGNEQWPRYKRMHNSKLYEHFQIIIFSTIKKKNRMRLKNAFYFFI